MSVDPRDSREVRSVPELIADLFRETGELFRTEGQLIRSEIGDKIRQIEVGGGSIAAGAICLLVSLIVLAGALVVAVSKIGDMGGGWAALIVGVAIAVVGVLLLMKGKRDLEPSNLTPERTAQQLRKDGQLVKEQTR
ncbi:phage holin family protein [Mangrovicella endophytica]|uniref:phage holin family protein n=1 Tax=Mangrovicella endophytica TaxID=2066697 RepID=UPI000C9DA832|nr:phage holin family protein [Mangrovicella endophytica]